MPMLAVARKRFGFNTTLVRLKDAFGDIVIDVFFRFNTTLVRLKDKAGDIATGGGDKSFNTTLVRLKAIF